MVLALKTLLPSSAPAKSISPKAIALPARNTRAVVLSTVGLTGLTILSGAFVAGNDAGNAYNTYPLMDGRWIPWEDMVDPSKGPVWRNAFETTATVQWNHRVLGTCTALTALGAAGYGLLAGCAPGSTTPPTLRLRALGTAARVRWLVNGRLAGETRGARYWTHAFPDPGPQRITALADTGAWAELNLRVVR